MINKSTAAKLDWIQALRGIAALLVVLCHARQYLSQQTYTPWIESLLLPGAMGVDLFFIISGFIMIYSTRNSDGSTTYALNFAIKRFCRIWPVYAAATIIYIVATNQLTAFINGTASIASFFKSIFFIPVNGLRALFFEPILPLGWTLDFEMYFYVVFGIAMLAGRFRWIAFFGWLLLTLVALPYLACGEFTLDVLHDYHFSIAYLNQVTNPMTWTFAAGVLIGLVYLSPFRLSNGLGTKCLTIGAVATSIWWAYSGLATFHGIAQWGWPLAVALLILAVASKTIDFPVPRPMLWLGEISFSLYLAHYIAQGVITRTLNYFDRHDLTQTWSMIFITSVFALIFGAISHAVLEKRLSEWVRGRLLNLIMVRRESGSRRPLSCASSESV